MTFMYLLICIYPNVNALCNFFLFIVEMYTFSEIA